MFCVMPLGFAVENKKLSLMLVESQDGVDVKRIENYILLQLWSHKFGQTCSYPLQSSKT